MAHRDSGRHQRWHGVLAARVAIGLFASLTAVAASPGGKPNAPLLAAIEACKPDSRALLTQAVAIDSGTGDADGIAAIGNLFAGRLQALGASVRRVPSVAPGVGDNIVATLTGGGRGRVLLIAHLDTVFARGTVASRPPRWNGDHLIAPGAGDDKSGAVLAVCALGALQKIAYRDYARVDLLLNVSEEKGSPGSRDLIRSMAADSDAAINLERGIPTDQALLSRKGNADLVMEFTGRAAHAGLEPEKGHNAVLEATRVAQALGSLADERAGTSVNVTVLNGGDRINVIPDHAELKADVRAYTAAEFDRVERAAAGLAAQPVIAGVTITSVLERGFPPWSRVASTEALLARANRLYAELGRTLTGTTVGSAADVAFAAEARIPVIDGFGMEGSGAHGPDDQADFATLTPRAYLLARMVMDLGASPPAR